MPGLNTDLAHKAAPNFQTVLTAPVVGGSDSTISLAAGPVDPTTGSPIADTAVVLMIDATDANGNPTPNLQEAVLGVWNNGTLQLQNCLRGLDGTTAQAHANGAKVVQWFTATDWVDLIKLILTEHTQLGYHQSLLDANGNVWLSQPGTASAVNGFQINNATAGNPVSLQAIGADANIPVQIIPKGNGQVEIPNSSLSSMGLFNPHKFNVYWASPPANCYTDTGSQALFDTKIFDTGNDYSTSTHLFTAPVNGLYKFETSLQFNNGGFSGWIQTLLSINTALLYSNLIPTSTNLSTDCNLVTPLIKLNAGDTVGVVGKTSATSWGGVGGTVTFFSGWLEYLA